MRGRDIYWAVIAQVLNVGSGLILLPIVLHFMSSEEVGLWYVFQTLAGFALLLDFGFQPTLLRNTAYVYAGAQQIEINGLSNITAGSWLNLQLLADLLAAARRIYKLVAMAVGISLMGLGTIYLSLLVPQEVFWKEVLPAWILFSSGYVVNSYYGYVLAVLQGRGNVTLSNKILIASKIVLVGCSVFLILVGYGLLGIGIAALISAIVGRVLGYHYLLSEKHFEEITVKHLTGRPGRLVSVLWHNSSRMGIAYLGSFLSLQGNMLVASGVLGMREFGSYGLSMQLLVTLSNAANIIMSLKFPQMNKLQLKNDQRGLRQAFGFSLLSSWILYSSGALLIVVIGDIVLRYLSSETVLLPFEQMAFLAMIVLLEMTHSNCANYLTTLNHVPYVKAVLYTGIAITLGSAILTVAYGAGVWGLLLARAISQGVYNNWKWPRAAFQHLQTNIVELAKVGAMEVYVILINARGKV